MLSYHSGVLVAALAVAEGGGQCRGAALVIAGRLSVIGGRVNRDGPHRGGVPITVTIVIRATVTRGPHVDRAQSVTALHRKVLKAFSL